MASAKRKSKEKIYHIHSVSNQSIKSYYLHSFCLAKKNQKALANRNSDKLQAIVFVIVNNIDFPNSTQTICLLFSFAEIGFRFSDNFLFELLKE